VRQVPSQQRTRVGAKPGICRDRGVNRREEEIWLLAGSCGRRLAKASTGDSRQKAGATGQIAALLARDQRPPPPSTTRLARPYC
jgi:hypothetical protein